MRPQKFAFSSKWLSKSALLLASVLMPAAAFAYDKPSKDKSFACWDQSFAYNAFRATKTEKWLEASFSGATLGTVVYSQAPGREINTDGWSQGIFHIAFPLSSCNVTENTMQCDWSIPNTLYSSVPLFFNRPVDNLGEITRVNSIVEFEKIVLNLDKQAKSAYLIMSGLGKEFTIGVTDCTSTFPAEEVAASFPQKIRDYLSKPK